MLINVTMPDDMTERMTLVNTMTKERHYKLISVDLDTKNMVFETSTEPKTESQNGSKPQILCD
jgi:hypothetical protein